MFDVSHSASLCRSLLFALIQGHKTEEPEAAEAALGRLYLSTDTNQTDCQGMITITRRGHAKTFTADARLPRIKAAQSTGMYLVKSHQSQSSCRIHFQTQ